MKILEILSSEITDETREQLALCLKVDKKYPVLLEQQTLRLVNESCNIAIESCAKLSRKDVRWDTLKDTTTMTEGINQLMQNPALPLFTGIILMLAEELFKHDQ